MSSWIFELRCPRCGEESQTEAKSKNPPPKLKCGECLMNDTEIVELRIVKATVDISNVR